MAKADFVTGLILIVFALTVFEESWTMPRLEHLGAHSMSVPGLVPGLLSAIIFILGVVLTIRSIKRGGHHMGITRNSLSATLVEPGNIRFLVTLVLTVVYAGFLIGTVPYWLCTGLFVFLFVAIFEWRRDATSRQRAVSLAFALGMAVIVSGAVTWVFESVFLVTLP